MMKKALIILAVLILIVGMLIDIFDGTATLAELYHIDRSEQIFSIKLSTPLTPGGIESVSKIYTEGDSVYQQYVNLLFSEKVFYQKLPEDEMWPFLYNYTYVEYHFASHLPIVIAFSIEEEGALVMTTLGTQRLAYRLLPDFDISFEEIERLARGDGE